MIHRYIPVLLAFITAAIAWFTTASLQQSHQAAVGRATDETHHLAQALDQHAVRSFQEVDSALTFVTGQLQREDLNQPDSAALSRDMHAWTERSPQIRSLLVLDSTGQSILDGQRHPARTINATDRPYFRFHLENPDGDLFISPPFQSRFDGDWTITLSRAIRGLDGNLAGVVVAGVELSYFQTFYAKVTAGTRNTVTLFRDDGTLLLREPFVEGWLGQNLRGREAMGRIFGNGEGSFEAESPIDGVARLISYRRIEGLPLVVVVSMTRDQVLAAWYDTVRSSVIFAGLIVALTWGFGLPLAHIVRRLGRAEKEARLACTTLDQERATLKAMLATLSDGVCLLGPDFDLIGHNDRLFEIMDVDREAILREKDPATAFLAILARRGDYGGGDVDELVAAVKDRLRSPGPRHYRRSLKAGQWIEVRSTPIPGYGFLIVVRDVSDEVRREQAFQTTNAQLAALSREDALTSLANRRRFDETLATEWARAKRSGLVMSMLMLDIDHFKQFNDHYGHVAGDECLRQIGHAIGGCIQRATDLAARYGGEEFGIILPETDVAGAAAVATAILEAVAGLAIDHVSGIDGRVTVSIGIAAITPAPDQPARELIEAADDALYRAKRSGRNQAVVAATHRHAA